MNEKYILGSKINDITFNEALNTVRGFLSTTKPKYIVTPGPEICLRGYKDRELAKIIRLADLSLPDGFGLKIGGLITGQPIINRITGVDFSLALCELAQNLRLKIMLIGGKGISGNKALEKLKNLYPDLNAYYLNGGIFDDKGNSEFIDFVERVNQIQPDILFVNLGSPKQEYFMANNLDKLNTKVMLGVGGTLDYISGVALRAPVWMRSLGLEWLYRILVRPPDDAVFNRRSFVRIFNAVIIFPLTCLVWVIRSKFFYRKNVAGIILNDENNLLLVKRKLLPGEESSKEFWQFPQGGVERGESLETAVRREMSEEVGLNELKFLKSATNLYRYDWNGFYRSFYPYKGQSQSYFLFKSSSQEVTIDTSEIEAYKWVSWHHVTDLVHPVKKESAELVLKKFEDIFSNL